MWLVFALFDPLYTGSISSATDQRAVHKQKLHKRTRAAALVITGFILQVLASTNKVLPVQGGRGRGAKNSPIHAPKYLAIGGYRIISYKQELSIEFMHILID